MSTIDTSTWSPDSDLNVSIGGIPLNADAGIAQTWQALRVLMAAVKGDGDAIKGLLADAVDGVLQTKIYPVGSTYFSLTDSRNPATILGFGTWAKIEGRFLLGASSSYAADSTGGEETHTLTENEMPSHNHGIAINPGSKFSAGISYTTGGAVNNNFVLANGGGQPHNNMPPYLAGHLWRRTA